MTTQDAPLTPGSVVADRFVIERLAGEGGMGRVYRALDQHRSDVVALKVMSLQRGRAKASGSMGALHHGEARTLVELVHPNIVRCIAFGTTPDGREFLATEWLEGETLRDRLSVGALPMAQALAIVRLAAEGLAAAHAWGIIHRDVTPANIMVLAGEALRVKVLDFGLAVQRLGDTSSAGTVGYAAPEQARGDRAVDARADVFGLGCVLYECLLGERPFAADTDVAVLARMFERETARVTERLVGVPTAVVSLLSRMLASDPEARPRDAGVVATELSGVGASGPEIPSSRSVTGNEQRVLSVLVASTDKASDPRLLAELASLGASVRDAAPGLLVCELAGETSAAERAVRGARAALAVRRFDAHARVSIVAVSDASRGAADAQEALPDVPSIVVDEDTARLLGDRFVVRPSGDALELVRDGGTYRSRTTLFGRETRCIGRDREIALIASVFDECASEPDARVVWLTGPAGIGKSRVRDEVLKRVASATVWSAQADPTRAGVPLGILAELLRSASGFSVGDEAVLQRTAVTGLAAALAPADRARAIEFACELLRLPITEPSVQLRAAREEAILMGDQLTRAFCDFALAATSSPLVIVVEDLQWADVPSIRALDDLVRLARDRPLMVMLIGRPEAKDTHVRILADRQPTGVSLGKLGNKAMEKLVGEVLGASADATAIASIAHRAGGNPFFAEELLRAANQDPLHAAASPTAALAVVETRLSAFEPEARRVLRAASTFGQEFDARGVAALLGDETSAEYVDAWCTWLAEREVLAQRVPGQWFFRQGLVRDGAYAMLTQADRKTAHGLAAEWLEREGRAAESVLAEHYAKAAEPAHAARWLAAAATVALEANDLSACVDVATRALETVDGIARGQLLVVLAEALRWRGEYDRAVSCAREAIGLLPIGGARFFRAAAELVAVSGSVGPADAFEQVVSTLVSVSPRDDVAKGPASMAWSRAAMQLMVRSDARAEILLERANDAAVSDLARARVEQAFAVRAGMSGHLEELALRYEASVAALERAGDLRTACVHELNLAAALCELGQDARARERLARGAAEAARRGLSSAMALGRHVEGILLAREGRLEAALSAQRDALHTFLGHGNARMSGGVRCVLAEVYLQLGAIADAERDAAQAVSDLASAPPARARALAVLAMVQAARGDREAAVASSSQAVEIALSAGVEGGESLVHVARIEALTLVGSPEVEQAKRVGRERLLAHANGIHDPALRESFLTRVPENARLFALTQ